MGSIYVCPKCEVEVKYSKLFCSCGTQLVRTDDALADDVFRKYRESNGIEVPKTDNEGKTKTSQDVVNEADTSLGAKENTNKHESVNVKNILIQTIYFISTFWVFAGFTLSYASYVSYLSLFLITLIVYVAIYKINLGNYSASVKKTTYWSLFAGVFLMVAVMDINPYLHRSIEFISKGFDYGTCSIGRMFSSPPKLRLKDAESDARLLYENSTENISPVYLNSIFRNGTDLQKTNAGRSINGKFVKWRLKVDNISEFYGKRKIKITTQAGAVDSRSDTTKQWQGLADSLLGLVGNQLFSPIYENQNIGVEVILELEANDPAYLNLLKSDDWIVVRGKIDDVIGDRIRLSPALIENSHTLALYTSAKNKINQHKSELQKYNEKSCMLNLSVKTSKPDSEIRIDQINDSNKDSVRVNDPRVSIMKYYLSTIKTLQSFSGDINNPDRDLTVRWKGNDGAIEELDIRVFFEENNGEATASVGKWQTDYVLATYKMKFIKDRWEIIQTCNWIWSAEENDDVLKCKAVKNGNI